MTPRRSSTCYSPACGGLRLFGAFMGTSDEVIDAVALHSSGGCFLR